MKNHKRLAKIALNAVRQLDQLDQQIAADPKSQLALLADAYRYAIVLEAIEQATRK